MMLAGEITELYHGKEAADGAGEHFKTVFQKSEIPENAPVLFLDAGLETALGNRL